MWVLALCQHRKELTLLMNPIVQLMLGALKLSNSVKYYPFHMKLFSLLTLITEKTGEFLPISQYILQIFEQNLNYFNQKPKPLADKQIPETLVSLKIAKKHIETSEMKDRILKESLEHLGHYYTANSRSYSFPELVIPASFILRKFKKNCSNSKYR